MHSPTQILLPQIPFHPAGINRFVVNFHERVEYIMMHYLIKFNLINHI